jgi:branched-chain amino acid transport system substrate-binding protein
MMTSKRVRVRWFRLLTTIAMTGAAALLVLLTVPMSATAASAASRATPVVVGDICSCTGPLASTAQQTGPTLEAWASWVNAHGGLSGHPVKLLEVDDLTSATTAVAEVGKFVAADHVVAIFDNSEVDINWAKIAANAGVPIFGGADSDLSYDSLDTFTSGPTLNYGITGQEIGIKHLTSLRKEAILYCVESPACSSETAVAGKVAPKYGIKVVYTSGISFSAPSYAAQCLAAKEAGADVIEVGDATTIAEKVASDCATQGWEPPEVAAATAATMLTIPQFKGMIASQQDIPYFVHNAATKDYYAALDKYAPTLQSSANFGEQSILAWAEGALLQSAVKTATPSSGTAMTGAEIKKGLYNLPAGDTLGGIAPQALHFTKGKFANFSCWDYISVTDGKFNWANGQKPLCGYLIKPGAPEGSPFLEPRRT